MRRFAYEHWGLVSSLVGFLIVPWTMLFFICPDVPGALRDIPLRAFLAGLAMCVVAGVASIGISFSFVYTQEAIGAAFMAHGTEAGKASAAVRVVTLLAAVAVIAYGNAVG